MRAVRVIRRINQRRKTTLGSPNGRPLSHDRFDNMLMRFEEPNSMVRWDSPLYTIPYDEEAPCDAIWQTITTGAKAPPTAAVANVSGVSGRDYVGTS